MKKSGYLSFLAIASFAVAPFAASIADESPVQACVNAFIAEKFADKQAVVRTNDRVMPMPLVARTSLPVQLAAYDNSGRMIASTTCTARNGTVTVAPVTE